MNEEFTTMQQEASGMGMDKQSAYSPFKLESYRLVQLKEQYEQMLRVPNYDMGIVISQAQVLAREAFGIWNQSENIKLTNLIKDMNKISNDIREMYLGDDIDLSEQSFVDEVIETRQKFESVAYIFLQEFNVAQINHGLGAKMKDQEDQIPRIKRVFKIYKDSDDMLYNGYGVPISPEMLLLASLCRVRVNKKYDNVFLVEADTGDGKTNFTWAAASTINWLGNLPFTINKSFIFNEDREYVDKFIKNLQVGEAIILDELGNQANAKLHFDRKQIDFMNDFRLIRFHGLTIFGNWTSKEEIDKQYRTRVNGIISIKERGKAQFRTFNKNPFAAKQEFIPYSKKNSIVFDGQEANKMMEEFDEFNHLTIPFFDVGAALPDQWKLYEAQKNQALTMKRRSGEFFSEMNAKDYYTQFLVNLPPNCVRVTSQMLDLYSSQRAYYLSFKKLIKQIADVTGRSPSKIFVSSDPLKTDVGYFDVDDVIDSFIKKLRAQSVGSKVN